MKKYVWMMVLLVLSACATTGRPGSGDRYWIKSDESYVGMDEAVSLLHYANHVRNLNGTDRERETERQRLAFVRDKSDFRRLQYALALATAEAGANERKQAQQLLEPMLEGRHNSGLTALATLLNAHLFSLGQGQKRIDELEKKLDAVKDIERSLMRREKGKL